ncbi:MAG: PH domain-containing protein [Bryobacteraceae bacterium]
MSEIVIRPSMKLIRAGYTLVFAIVFVSVLVYANSSAAERYPAWVAFLPALLFLWPIRCHLQNRFTLMALAGDKLRYETGILSRSKRTIQLAKVQDVRVDQTLVQRMLGTGNLSVETAGETSLLTMGNVDDPDRVTDAILRAAHPEAGDGAKPQPKS